MREVRSKTGVPVAADFGSHSGTPIVVDVSTGKAYVITTAGSVVEIGGGSSASATWTELEVDFGTDPVFDSTFLISDATISGTSKVAVVPSGNAGTGRTADDWQWDGASIAAVPGSGQARCYVTFTPGPVVGARKFVYQVG